MLKEIIGSVGGVLVGVAIVYGGYRMYKYIKSQETKKNEDVFTSKLKEQEVQIQRFNDLIANQYYVRLLTSKELTSWFKANHALVAQNTKMIITIPTVENMRGLGYPADNDIDDDSNILQLFYDEESGEVLKIRLVNFTDIDSNLQACLIEHEGMLVVTD